MKTLTGKVRYRSAKLGLLGPTVLVLEVEEHTSDGPPDFNGMPTYLSGKYWRDAKVEDLGLILPKSEGGAA